MKSHEHIQKRFVELEGQTGALRRRNSEFGVCIEGEDFQRWTTSAMNLIKIAFGENSPHYENFKTAYENFTGYEYEFERAKGVFAAAKADFEGGYATTMAALVSGEIFGDFIGLAKESLNSNNKDVAAVLACAALEDALKRYATSEGLAVDGKDMSEVVGALKSKGLVGGAQKTLLETMPKIRNAAMHADWSKLTSQDVASVIGYTERFLIDHFS